MNVKSFLIAVGHQWRTQEAAEVDAPTRCVDGTSPPPAPDDPAVAALLRVITALALLEQPRKALDAVTPLVTKPFINQKSSP